MKVAVCAIGKCEERYLPKWVEHYKNIGFDNIIFYDNNDPGDNRQYEVLKPYIDSGFVVYNKYTLFKDYMKQNAIKCCYETYSQVFDWIAFFDVNEFLMLNKDNNIKEYLSNCKFKNSDVIQFDRMTSIYENGRMVATYNNELVKSIVKCGNNLTLNVRYRYMTNSFSASSKLMHVNDIGCMSERCGLCNNSFRSAYIKHIHSTSFNDFLNKLKIGNSKENRFNIVCLSYIEDKLRKYFEYVKFTNEHLNIIKKTFPDFGITKESIFNEIDLTIKTDIDYVFPYVDDSDDNWYREYKKYRGDVDYENNTASGSVRYKTYDLLKYKLRSIEQNMPWIRNIYMIVSSPYQVPDWLDTTHVKIVYHKNIIPDEFLPTFNSSTIEMFLGNIEGLGEKFLYGNDDFYVLKPVMPYMFFRGDKPLLHLKERNMDSKGKLEVNFIADAFIKNDINVAKIGTKYDDIEKVFHPDHHIKPMLKSKLNEIIDKNKEVIYNGCTRFRDFNNFNQYLYHYYNIFNDNYISYDRSPKTQSFNGDYEVVKDAIKKSKLLSLDFTSGANEETINGIFYNIFPLRSKYEKYLIFNGKMRLAVCAIGKWEEQYLPEWVEHYKNIGFDNIIFYDNNDPGDNRQYEVLKPYIDSGFVIYNDYRNKQHLLAQKNAYKHSNMKYGYKYDYIAYFDVDEFLELVGYKTIKEFINNNKNLAKADGIVFNWKLIGDGGLVYNDCRPLNDRFSQSQMVNNNTFKSIVKKTCKYISGYGVHSVHSPFFYKDKVFCTTSGEKISNKSRVRSITHCDDKAYIKHYRTKTIQETVIRIKRGYCNAGGYVKDPTDMNSRINLFLNQFCKINELTQEKLDVVIKEFPQFIDTEYYKKYKKILDVNKKNHSIISKSKCSGCSACENICPTNAITLKVDTLTGFKLVDVDNDKCINCGKCYKVCPHNTVNLHDLSEQKKYALKSLDGDVLKKSSSGGAFTHITLPLLEIGWKVIGVKWNKEWHVEYAIADTIEEWEKFRKSKYMQADMGDLFPRIREMLDNGEKIVFSGVPCHVSGLLNYLGKEYDNLLTIDLLCGALHSPKIWDEWYEYEGLDKSTFVDIDMRYKCNNGAGNHTIHIEKTNGQVHDIMTATTPIWSLTYCGRKMAMDVCHNCKYRSLDRVSDITISDMHNAKDIAPDFFDKRNNNVSSVLCNTLKGQKIINSLSLNDILIKEIEGDVKMPQNYKKRELEKTFKELDKNGISFPKIKQETLYDIAICGGTFNANFGATLTYYALYRYLELLGNKVVMLPPFDKEFNGGMLKGNVFEKYCNIAPNYFKSNPVNFNSLANTFILGSDQMWNPKCALYRELGLRSFLNYIRNNKNKIAYSVSTGGLLFPGTLEGDNKYDEVKRLLSKFDAISCRENDGCDLIKEHCDINADHTIDPVFLLPVEEYDKLIKESEIELPKGEYGCYYEISPNEKHLDFFHNLNKKLGIEDVVIGCGQPKKYKNYSVNLPNENFVNPINAQDWLKYIKNAKYVVTSSFHCVCFCIIFNIPFICLRSLKNIRINWILESTNLRDNYLKELDIDSAKEIINEPINHLHYLNEFIEYSKKWINKNI